MEFVAFQQKAAYACLSREQGPATQSLLDMLATGSVLDQGPPRALTEPMDICEATKHHKASQSTLWICRMVELCRQDIQTAQSKLAHIRCVPSQHLVQARTARSPFPFDGGDVDMMWTMLSRRVARAHGCSCQWMPMGMSHVLHSIALPLCCQVCVVGDRGHGKSTLVELLHARSIQGTEDG